MPTNIVRRHFGDREKGAIPIHINIENRNDCPGSPYYVKKNAKRSRLRKNATARILLVFVFLFLICLGLLLRFKHSREQAFKEHVDLRLEIPAKNKKKETDNIVPPKERPRKERKNGEKYSQSEPSILDKNKNQIDGRTSIGFDDWPLSRLDEIRKDPSKKAKLPASASSLESIDCPQCSSILAGAALHKRFLLLGHELNFAGGEIWLRDLGEMLEKSGAIVRFLFLSKDTPDRTHLLQSHIEKGLSYRFWDSEGDDIAFSDFDFVIANTVAVETWWHFYKTTSSYKSKVEMEKLYGKTIFCIHEYNPRQFRDPFLNTVLQKVPKILFDSDAGKKKWVEILPEIASKSQTLHPGIPKKLMLPLMNVSNEKKELQKKLEIPVTDSSDVVILQASSIVESKGIPNLIDAFHLMHETLGEEIIHERAWFLVLVGEAASDKIKKRIQDVNGSLVEKGTRSRILLRPATSEIADYYGASDIFTLNSMCENFGLVTVEAMLAGVPTISRDCGGAKEIVQHGVTGLLLPNEEQNKVELSKAILKITTGDKWKQSLRKMGKAGKTRAMKEFSYMRMARDFSNVIAEQRYFSDFDKKWTCSAQEESKGKVITYRSHNNDNSPDPPMLPVIKSYDIGCANVGSDLYLFGGYQDLNHVTKTMQFYDLKANVWVDAPALPENAAESHMASTNDSRYFYSISGQLGAQCSPPVKSSFAYDTVQKQWLQIPDLPVARYGGCAGILNNRLHFVGGFDKDRRTPMSDHFSMSVDELHSWFSNPLVEEPSWRKEKDIPGSAGHVLCSVLSTQEGQELYFFGGEANDYFPRDAEKGDNTCVPGLEFNKPFVFSYDGQDWKRGPDMPYPLSHAEGSKIVSEHGDGIFIFGGSSIHEQELAPDIPILTDGILYFSSNTKKFKRVGNIFPLGMGRKGTCGIGHIENDDVTMFVVGGQGSVSRNLPMAGPINKFTSLCKGGVEALE